MNKDQAKLKSARKKIEAVLREYDIAGLVSLHSGGDWGELFWNIWPSWSILQGDFPSIRIKSLPSQLTPEQLPKELERRTATSAAIHHLATSMGGVVIQFLELSKILDEKLGAEHTNERFESDPSPDADGGMH